MSRTSVSLPALTSASNGDEVERDGIVYKFDSSIGSSGQWQTVLNRNLTVVTKNNDQSYFCLLYTSPSPRDRTRSRMPSSA